MSLIAEPGARLSPRRLLGAVEEAPRNAGAGPRQGRGRQPAVANPPVTLQGTLRGGQSGVAACSELARRWGPDGEDRVCFCGDPRPHSFRSSFVFSACLACSPCTLSLVFRGPTHRRGAQNASRGAPADAQAVTRRCRFFDFHVNPAILPRPISHDRSSNVLCRFYPAWTFIDRIARCV